MTLFKVSMLQNSHVLLLEDSDTRIAWFTKRIPNLKVVKTVDDFKKYFDGHPIVDFIFFDHDLGTEETGADAAKFVAEKFGANRYGMIHSWNKGGSQKIQSYLPNIPHIPFGDFEIEFVD